MTGRPGAPARSPATLALVLKDDPGAADSPPPGDEEPPSNGEQPPPAAESQPPSGRAIRATQLRWAVLDALVPGVGHLAAGRRRLGLLFGIPTLLALVALAAVIATTSLPRLAAGAVNLLGAILIIEGLVLIWRLLAVVAAVIAVGPRRPALRHGLDVALLIAVVILPQAYLGYVTNVAREEVDRVFAGETNGAWIPPPTAEPTRDPTAIATASPTPAPTPEVPRVNVLLIGVDSGAGRNTSNTDTMIVASLDPVTETVSILSIPRDMVNVPLPDGSIYAPKLNGLDSTARHHPSTFPGSDGSGHDVLMAALGTLLNLKIDYYAAVNLPGFVAVVDTIGGVDVTVARNLCDSGYTEYGFENGFSIKAGLRHLNGQEALAYARIRKAAGESDFTRAARQQEVISGLRDAIVKRGFLSDPVALLQALGRSMSTNVPRDILPDLADIMTRVDRAHTYRAVIRAPLVGPGFDVRGSIQVPDIQGIRDLATHLFPEPGTLPDVAYAAPPSATKGSGSGTGNCVPAATPGPTPAPTTAPGATATIGPSPTASPEPTAEPSPSASSATPEPGQTTTP